VIFENRDLDLAVAVGAAYYSYVRATGAGLLVRGGLPRAYFIGLGGGDGDALRTLCLVPRARKKDRRLSSIRGIYNWSRTSGIVPAV